MLAVENVKEKNHPHTTICLSNHYILIFVLFVYIPLHISRNDVLEMLLDFSVHGEKISHISHFPSREFHGCLVFCCIKTPSFPQPIPGCQGIYVYCK